MYSETSTESQDKPDVFAIVDDMIAEKPVVNPAMTYGRVKLERAPNAIQFIESPRFLAGPSRLWPEQYNIVRDFYELLCPFCNDMPYIQANAVPRDEQVLFEYGVCPECSTRRDSIVSQLQLPNTLIGVGGQRSGKSAVIAGMSAYHIHEALCVEDLPQKMGVLAVQDFEFSFAAAAGLQASETVYAQFRGLYDASPWFQELKQQLQMIEKSDPMMRKGDLYWDTDLSIHWKDKHLRVRSITTNAATHRGITRIGAVIDELAWLDAGDSKRSANEVYRALKNSLLTVRSSIDTLRSKKDYSLLDGLLMCVTSPLFIDDRSMQLLKEADKNKKIFAFHKATWELTPTITRESLESEFQADPIGAERDFGAKPPGAENPFISRPEIVDLCIDTKRNNAFDLREDFFEQEIVQNGLVHIFRYVKMVLLGFKYNTMFEYAIHCDAGERRDSFCMAIGHREVNRCIIDGAIEVRPIPKERGRDGYDVHFPAMIDLILTLKSRFGIKIKIVTYDRWNSTDHIHRLISSGILAFGKYLNREDHINFLQGINNQAVLFPALETSVFDPAVDRNVPCAKAIHELKRLEDTGVKVDHGRNGTNDMIQCYVGVHRSLMHPEQVIPDRKTLASLGGSAINRPPSMKVARFKR
jgi:hypothetical protein